MRSNEFASLRFAEKDTKLLLLESNPIDNIKEQFLLGVQVLGHVLVTLCNNYFDVS